MPVSGRELATLDFGNLIGGPLNAIVEAQARSAITTANFIREVGFDQDGKVINVDFSYTRKDDQGQDQDFTLTVPFITMLPIPYVTVESGTIEFNAKITSITESHSEQNFEQVVDASASTRAWFVNASVQSKTSYQKKSSNSDKEERTFDMHVMVQVRNQDMPSGTERLLTLLENVIEEKQVTGGTISLTVTTDTTATDTKIEVAGNLAAVVQGGTFMLDGAPRTVSSIDTSTSELTFAPALANVVKVGTPVTVKNPPKVASMGTRRAPAPLPPGPQPSVPAMPDPRTAATTVVTEMVIDGDISKFTTGARLSVGGINYTIVGLDPAHNKLLLSRG
ncbi:DUF2589 domain-containing protein [Chondromyces crocatus]|uniref:DUF2589 domain-containing protein n=1 Tax=Chondromyces crocatus TaxID=52 RepID=A0A0K1ES02_CHOCO|nr:DUF2589 domain-containing protein [Chondromyces crocatus]AKT43564.1 uncharacterized protein CMC5_077960 [Chondromyces crocatus]